MPKKAVISLGAKQYLVNEKQVLDVESVGEQETLKIKPLLVIDGDNVLIGTPELDKPVVTAKVLEFVKADKVVSIRYKAKKRVHKQRGHRQQMSRIQITSIS